MSVDDGKVRGLTSSVQFVALPLVKPVVSFARAVVLILLLNQPITCSKGAQCLILFSLSCHKKTTSLVNVKKFP